MMLARAARIAVACTVVCAGAAFAAYNPGNYTGTTSEHQPVSFQIKGATVVSFKATLGYNGKCGPGGGPTYNVRASSIVIGGGGKFAKNVTLRFNSMTAPGQIKGVASGSRVTGGIVQFLHGKPNRCYSESFTANRH